MKKNLLSVASLLLASTLSMDLIADTPSRLYLQQVGSHSAIVKWRGDADQVCYGKKLRKLNKKSWSKCVAATLTSGGQDKEALLSKLAPDKTYYYSLGSPGPGSANIEQNFRTAPSSNKPPKDGNTHIWMIGDSGTQTEINPFTGEPTHPGEAEEVKQGFLTYNADKEPVDLFVLLGDNAYFEGTDAQWQGAFFDIYPNIMNKAAVWPTIGNHEMGGDCLDYSVFMSRPPGSFIR